MRYRVNALFGFQSCLFVWPSPPLIFDGSLLGSCQPESPAMLAQATLGGSGLPQIVRQTMLLLQKEARRTVRATPARTVRVAVCDRSPLHCNILRVCTDTSTPATGCLYDLAAFIAESLRLQMFTGQKLHGHEHVE